LADWQITNPSTRSLSAPGEFKRQGLDDDLSIEGISQKAMALKIKNTEQNNETDT